MKARRQAFVPLLVCAAVVGTVLVLHTLGRQGRLDFLERLEWMTFDWRVRQATNAPSQNASNLGFVFISNDSIDELASGSLGFTNGLYWPRFVYGWVVSELKTQGAEAVGFDLLFPELRRDHTQMPDGTPGTPDDAFARALRDTGNVILGAQPEAPPHTLFRTNAWGLGNISALRDSDGILRRVRAFQDYVIWHPMILEAARRFDGFVYDTNRLLFTAEDGKLTGIPIDPFGNYDAGKLLELGTGRALPAGAQRLARAFTRQRVWDLGIMLAAHSLKLDLGAPTITPGREILLRGAGGIERRLPIDHENRLCVDWSFPLDSPQLTRESFHGVLRDHLDRSRGQTNQLRNLWRGKLVLVGSIASGNDLTDLGATPLEQETVLTCRYWNVANSVLTGRFVRQPPLAIELFLIVGLAAAAAVFAWRMRALGAALATFLITALYAGIASQVYLQSRIWLPVFLPCAGLVLTHFALVTYRAIFEQSERRRIKGVFDKIVSPNVVSELLKTEKLSLGGARRSVTVFFADVRGFTELTDESHARATAHVTEQRLTGAEAEAHLDSQSEELLRTVNLYLGAIADIVKKHQGTLDKYIGDSVMAFWGAPTPNERHALTCVRAAIEAQRALHHLNQQRAADNKRREEDNLRRAAAGEPRLPLLKLFSIGIGVNTGTVTVGLLGSERHTLNYTIVGREVNLAQRLESHSGRDRILIGEATHKELLRDDPELAAACQPQLATQFKGFRSAIQLFEVPWRPAVLPIAAAPPAVAAAPSRAAA